MMVNRHATRNLKYSLFSRNPTGADIDVFLPRTCTPLFYLAFFIANFFEFSHRGRDRNVILHDCGSKVLLRVQSTTRVLH